MLYQELFFRNHGVLSARQQSRLRNVKVAIIGLGGTGGVVLENLVRSGVAKFVVFDFDKFELTNMNRQLLATIDAMDTAKAAVAKSRVSAINPKSSITTYGKRFVCSDARKLSGCDLVFDCSDNLPTRFEIAHACQKLKLPFVFCSASFTRGMVSVFYPPVAFEKIFGHLKSAKTCSSVVCSAPFFAGTLAAWQGICVLLDKPCVRAPEFLFFDLDSKAMLWRQRL